MRTTILESVLSAITRLHRDEKGQGMTEYVIILVAVSVGCIAVSHQLGRRIDALFGTVISELELLQYHL